MVLWGVLVDITNSMLSARSKSCAFLRSARLLRESDVTPSELAAENPNSGSPGRIEFEPQVDDRYS